MSDLILFARLARMYRRREGDCAPTEPLVSRLESIEDAGHTLVLLLCLAVLLVMVPALIFGVSWKDAIGWLAMIGGAL